MNGSSSEHGLHGQPLPPWRRAVLKVGSNLLAADGGGLTAKHAATLAAFIAASQAQGREVVLVSSGAVGAGRALLRGEDRAAVVDQQYLERRIVDQRIVRRFLCLQRRRETAQGSDHDEVFAHGPTPSGREIAPRRVDRG